MEASEKQLLKEKIKQELTKTQLAIKEYEEMSKPVSPENAIGRISRMDAINNKSISESALRKAREKLKNLEYMQNHLDDADFGKCSGCGDQIPVGRLLFRPESRRCIRCAH